MADFQTIAKQFTDYYYSTFDNDRSQLAALYRDGSMMTWEATPHQGSAAIIEKLKSLPFQSVRHAITTLDAQPASQNEASIMCMVTGQLMVDDGQNVLQYSQTFHLRPEGSSYYVQNDIFRLVYG
ncbi:hypothetical protein BD324DRAFT_628549 [Kockovaella imperatae]|uniref:Nuclear transport factor 2 n=1 Tax=Kockovaella imperatae TaxID=4999 RepID=A0A1Y1UE99_9TREE|nr:hypothetical protein BD324DRAFT_628549 [Kockovaella imperatae]ORX36368.1 hypothetical protein BD324DRAFT_628549 [Kockovaella imperatae]